MWAVWVLLIASCSHHSELETKHTPGLSTSDLLCTYITHVMYSWYFSGTSLVLSGLLDLLSINVGSSLPWPHMEWQTGATSIEGIATEAEFQIEAAMEFQYLKTKWAVFTQLTIINPNFCNTILSGVDWLSQEQTSMSLQFQMVAAIIFNIRM
jgi:hypothetical protein